MQRSGYLQKQSIRTEATLRAAQEIVQQLMLDTAGIVLHQDFGWGYERIKRFTDEWMKSYDAFFPAVERPKEMLHDARDIYRTRLDNCIREYMGEHKMYTFEERYPSASIVRYGK